MDQLTPPSLPGIRSRQRRRGSSGFTLLEVMVALSLLAFGLLAMLAMQIHALREGKVGRHVTQAAQVARDRLEIFQRLPWTDPQLAPTVGPAGWLIGADTQDNDVWVDGATTVREQRFNVDWRITDIAFDPTNPAVPVLKQIDVRVTWREPGDPAGMAARRFAATTRRFN